MGTLDVPVQQPILLHRPAAVVRYRCVATTNIGTATKIRLVRARPASGMTLR
ncbi:ubiquitin family protein [Nocardia cyriacigeorgica]|uniref:hypothetical protein n=1 Tax=Nocardia cyriacigeorgica TaxID=135487 RepID=UPI0018932912|nr:hypothetical protein [Nocardia cyriacigeorgica]MBF6413987.1 hypothetical protein [Nocardia cyriacigeorgica]